MSVSLVHGDLVLLRDVLRRRSGAPDEEILSPGRRRLLVASLLLQIVLAADGFLVEPFALEVERPRFALKGLAPPRGAPPRIVHLSDFHCEAGGPVVPDLVKRVRAERPDLVVCTGDYLNRRSAAAALGRVMRELRALAPVVAVRGNFDGHPLTTQILEEAGVEILDGRARLFEIRGSAFEVHGVSLWTRHRLDELARGRRRSRPAILLCHVPDLIDRAAALGYDLVLCGHTHGGQIRVPGYGAIVTLTGVGKRYEAGRYRRGDTEAWVSRGLGMEPSPPAPPVRLFCRPELTSITLEAR